jgi:hypothetical protein
MDSMAYMVATLSSTFFILLQYPTPLLWLTMEQYLIQ